MTTFDQYLQKKYDEKKPDMEFLIWLMGLEPHEWIIYGTGYGELTVEEFIEETKPEVSAENYL